MSTHSSSGSKPSGMWQPPTLEEMQAMLPQYQFVSLLGRGGMGAVYKAVQVSLDRAVAVKVLPGDLIDDTDAQFAERFKNEARTMAKMNHPSIVNVYDFGETQTGLLFIVMEFIDGTDVSKMIMSQGKLPEDYALSITAHVCDALNYAHRNGVIHRDIKPANILINMDGAVKVADFGLAKQSDAGMSGLTKTNMAMGTPDFVAPEALIPGVPLDGRADLYAIGVMLYQMLTGEIPRGMWTMPGTKLGTDPRFDAIIGKAMQTDREVRYQSAADLRRDLDTILTTPRAMTQPQPAAAPAQTTQKPQAHGPRVPQGQKAADKPPSAPTQSKKANLGMFIGLGATAVLLIGGYVLLKPPAPSQNTVTAAASAPAAPPKPAPQPSAAPKPAPAPSQMPPQRVAKQTLDLLALTDPALDRVPVPSLIGKNEWKREGGELVFQPDGRSGKLAAPVAFDCRDYEIEFKAKKNSGNDRIHMDVPLRGGRILPIILNGQSRKVLNEKAGMSWGGSSDGLVHVTLRVIDGVGASDRIVIQRQNVKGNPLADWSGDLDTLAKLGEDHPAFPKQPVTSVFVMRDNYAVQMWTLRVFEGEAKVLRGTTSPVVSSAPPQPAPATSGNAVNLIDGIAIRRDAVSGGWSQRDGELYGKGSTQFDKFVFNAVVPEEYDFRVVFTRTSGDKAVAQHLVLPDGQDVMWIMGGFGNNVFALETVDGAAGNANPTKVTMGLENGRRYESVVKVRRDRIQAEIDGKLILDYKTAGSRLAVYEKWSYPDAKQLGVGCQQPTTFHRIELIPFTSKPVGSAPAVATSSPAAPSVVMPAPAAPVSPPLPPPASDPVSVKLADLEAKFQAAFERDAGAAYKAQLAKLNTGYVTALDRALAAASKAGNLDEAVVLREEKERMTSGKGLPPEDLDTLPESLKKLRGTWRGAEAGYAKQRNALAAPLFDAYDKALDAFQTELTKQNKIDDALRVKIARDELVQRRASIAPAAVETPAPAKAATSKPAGGVAIESSSSWRKAAEWILSVGGEIRIRAGATGNTAVKDAKDLPGGRFDITNIILNLPNGKGAQITDDDLTRFNGLRGIEVVSLVHLPGVTGAGLAALAASADSMREVTIYDVGLQPQHVGFIAQFKNLKNLTFDGLKVVTSESLTRLGELRELRNLRMLQTPAFDDRALLALAGLTKLESFDTTNATFTDEGMAAFKGMKDLKNLSLGGITGVRGPGLAHIAGASGLTRLNLDGTQVADESLAAISGLKSLTDVSLSNTSVTSACLKHLGPLKQLRTLSLSAEKFTGAGFDALAGCNELRQLVCGGGGGNPPCNITDDGLRDLAKATLPKLEQLSIKGQTITDAGYAHLTVYKLKSLYLEKQPGVEGMRAIATISTLETLNFGGGPAGDAEVVPLTALKGLKYLSFYNSEVTDATLPGLLAMPNLKSFYFYQSKITPAAIEAAKKTRPDLKIGR